MRISDWSSDVCSSDLGEGGARRPVRTVGVIQDITDRKRAELALAASEERLRLAQGLSGVGSYDWDILRDKAEASDVYQIGRASCRERVCQYVEISVVAVSLKKKANKNINNDTA